MRLLAFSVHIVSRRSAAAVARGGRIFPRFKINQPLRLTKSEVIASHGGRHYTLESNNLVTFGGSFQQRRGVRTLWVMTDATLPGATNNANKQLINTLLHSRLFRDYENVFTRATGLALALRPLEYWLLEPLEKARENRFCALLAKRRATLADRKSVV